MDIVVTKEKDTVALEKAVILIQEFLALDYVRQLNLHREAESLSLNPRKLIG